MKREHSCHRCGEPCDCAECLTDDEAADLFDCDGCCECEMIDDEDDDE